MAQRRHCRLMAPVLWPVYLWNARLKLTLEAQLQSVAVCGDCFEVAGPSNASVALYDYGANSTSTFQLQLEWDPAYLGPLTVDLLPPVR